MPHLNPSKILPRTDETQRTDKYPALSDTLFEQILSSDNLKRAWKRVRANKGAPGIDGVSIEDFPQYLRDYWPGVLVQLKAGTYPPSPVRRVRIDKDDGGVRELGIPIILDRLIQQAIAQVLSPLFEPSFSEHSYGFRPKRSAHDAIQSVLAKIKLGRKIAVDVDLAKCFDQINHDFLMTQLGHRIKDKTVLKLIGGYLRAGINDNGTLLASREGVPQGGPLSPLLSNVVLDLLDKELERRGHHFARYADDFIILVRSQRAGERVLASITRFVQSRLKLQVNAHKSQVVPVSRAKFLGFCFPRNKIRCHPKALQRFKRQVRLLSHRTQGISMPVKIKRLSQYLRGWFQYFGMGIPYQLTVDLDQWIKRRVRMCYWKQWRKPRTKIRNLIKRGVPVKLAIDCGMSSKGYWRNARTKGIQMALNNQWLAKQGLLSLREQWISLNHG